MAARVSKHGSADVVVVVAAAVAVVAAVVIVVVVAVVPKNLTEASKNEILSTYLIVDFRKAHFSEASEGYPKSHVCDLRESKNQYINKISGSSYIDH